MAKLRYGEQEHELLPSETVLECCERVGVPVASSCRVGACQSCLVRATAGVLPPKSQEGLRPTLRERGYFLACVCHPTEDLEIALSAEGLEMRVHVERVERLSPSVVRLFLRPEEPFEYRAGQFLSILREDGLVRSYSLASLPDVDPFLEIHVREVPSGAMSRTLCREVRGSETFRVRGPAGECFYAGDDRDAPLLLVGTGTGLSPLLGVLRDALHKGHRGPITLVHGARTPEGLYLVDTLRKLAEMHPNVTCVASVLEGAPAPGVRVQALDDTLRDLHPRMAGHRVFLAGDPAIVQRLRRMAFLSGAAMDAIVADAFVEAPPPVRAASPAATVSP